MRLRNLLSSLLQVSLPILNHCQPRAQEQSSPHCAILQLQATVLLCLVDVDDSVKPLGTINNLVTRINNHYYHAIIICSAMHEEKHINNVNAQSGSNFISIQELFLSYLTPGTLLPGKIAHLCHESHSRTTPCFQAMREDLTLLLRGKNALATLRPSRW